MRRLAAETLVEILRDHRFLGRQGRPARRLRARCGMAVLRIAGLSAIRAAMRIAGRVAGLSARHMSRLTRRFRTGARAGHPAGIHLVGRHRSSGVIKVLRGHRSPGVIQFVGRHRPPGRRAIIAGPDRAILVPAALGLIPIIHMLKNILYIKCRCVKKQLQIKIHHL